MDENDQTIFFPKIRAIFFNFQKRHWRPLVVRLYWPDKNTKKLTLDFSNGNSYSSSNFTSFFRLG